MKYVEVVTYDYQEALKRGIQPPSDGDNNYVGVMYAGKTIADTKWFSKHMDAVLWCLHRLAWTWK